MPIKPGSRLPVRGLTELRSPVRPRFAHQKVFASQYAFADQLELVSRPPGQGGTTDIGGQTKYCQSHVTLH